MELNSFCFRLVGVFVSQSSFLPRRAANFEHSRASSAPFVVHHSSDFPCSIAIVSILFVLEPIIWGRGREWTPLWFDFMYRIAMEVPRSCRGTQKSGSVHCIRLPSCPFFHRSSQLLFLNCFSIHWCNASIGVSANATQNSVHDGFLKVLKSIQNGSIIV